MIGLDLDESLLQHTLILLYWCVFGTLVVLIAGTLFSARPVVALAVALFLSGFALRVVLIACNETMGLFEPKYAGNLSLKLFRTFILQRQDYMGLVREAFGPQVIWNLPVWTVLGPTRLGMLFGNAAAGALLAPITGVLLYEAAGRRASVFSMFVASVYLGGLNFSIFGLRDPLIMIGYATIAGLIVRYTILGLRRFELGTMVMVSVPTFWLRPEMFYVLVAIICLPLGEYYLQTVRRALRSRRIFQSAVILTFPLLLIGGLGIAAATFIAGKNVGVATSNPLQIAEENAENRFNRSAGALHGGNTHIVGEGYANIPVYLRIPIQTVALILCPLPWQVTNPARLFAFIDSLFLIVLGGLTIVQLYLESRRWNRHSIEERRLEDQKIRSITFWLMAIFAIGILGLGFVVSNAGNGFRMRLAMTPFLLVASSLAIPRIRWFALRRDRLSSTRSRPDVIARSDGHAEAGEHPERQLVSAGEPS